MTSLSTVVLAASEHADVVPVAADGVFSWLWLVVAIPAVSAAILLIGDGAGDHGPLDRFGHLLGTLAAIASFVVGLVAFIALLGQDVAERAITHDLWTWMQVGGFDVTMSVYYDQLAALFVLLITGVGSLIHVYSIGYMADDPRKRRFFGFLNLFIAAMLVLVLAGDYLVLFLGWEGVGLASYLLIGFWQEKRSAAVAAKKAFVVNRVGDLGLALGIMLMFAQFGTTNIHDVGLNVANASQGVATALGLLLLLGACGKSAQVPLQSWLLDAMEGPTPVSALIHAATMVTAGVYLVVRSAAIYDLSEVARTAVVVVGAVTLLYGAWIGCAKDDIKKALAGSTMSQIGYMMLAAGLGPAGYAFAIFHLITHGFFKANMFLGAGSVMHGMNDDVDMRHYGALRTMMPVTFVTFAMGYLAIIGFPGFSGFFSKDKVIEAAFATNFWAGLAALVGAGVTAFYMTRVMIMTFFGEKRWREGVHPHESPKIMTVPLIVLAALSVGGGALLFSSWIVDWLAPVTGEEHHELPVPPIVITAIIVLVVAAGIALAYVLFGRRTIPDTAPQKVSVFTRAGRADLYGDAVNEALFMRPGQYLTRSLVYVDGSGIDGAVNGTAELVGDGARGLRRLQTGFVRTYAAEIFGGALVLVLALLAVNLA
ncbi:NADH-quinone oxidoreductase subunit L [Mumia sp. zg.B53]|uniref:NADH-quinone oxidoreductase subunit L n=1 Tax=unclassified Mumia TaxID=2621872 RepID=UPI001C6F58DE|nr:MULTISPECIES: NADH-quinone oxidoreductase subunit L [unclassified Mumia]MBW9209386.1 NADH-quinone oxidoreductase subunit L [Mumia sp. zg.B21]MBW9213995.1 NADH-quinone oxidoreductase subunit L [Mumia sp. zg.B53]MDD9347218.1 NADH-quinone oxidoreductase subunit L [Mumia sp.]